MENRLIDVSSCSETKNNNEMKVVRGYEEVISISFIYSLCVYGLICINHCSST